MYLHKNSLEVFEMCHQYSDLSIATMYVQPKIELSLCNVARALVIISFIKFIPAFGCLVILNIISAYF